MKYINKYNNFNPINESINNKSVVDDIIDTMVDFIDEGEKITFYSPNSSYGGMTFQDYLSKNNKYEEFKPVNKAGNKIISKFSIIYRPKNNNYDGFVELMDNMKSTIGRLGADGWVLYDFTTVTDKSKTIKYGDEVIMNYVEFVFAKPDEILEEEFKLPDEDEISDKFNQIDIPITHISVEDHETTIEFGTYAYDGNLNSESWYDDKFTKICDLFGFSSYYLEYNKAKVTFEH